MIFQATKRIVCAIVLLPHVRDIHYCPIYYFITFKVMKELKGILGKFLITICLTLLPFFIIAPTNPALASCSPPPLPSSFWGTAQINGQQAPVGTTITAIISGQVFKSSEITLYNEYQVYSFDVPGCAGSIVADSNSTIIFKIGNLYARQTSKWLSGTNQEFNLTASVPVLTLVGPAEVTIKTGNTYSDQGATANDLYQGNISNLVTVSNTVNTSIIGTYTVTYNVKNSAGNSAQPITRTVTVVQGEQQAVSTQPTTTGTVAGVSTSPKVVTTQNTNTQIEEVLPDSEVLAETTTEIEEEVDTQETDKTEEKVVEEETKAEKNYTWIYASLSLLIIGITIVLIIRRRRK